MTHSTSSTPSNELLYLTDDVAIPRELFEAHQKGDLVLFVGAGASMSQPTGMPDFGRLAETLANKAGTSFLGENQDTDRLLGTLLPHSTSVATRKLSSKEKNPDPTRFMTQLFSLPTPPKNLK